MTKISNIHALEILDSRGNPTVEVIITLEDGVIAKAKVPSGASTGEHEALELRDNDKTRYFGKGVLKAVSNVNGPIKDLLKNENVFEQEKLDLLMIEKDGTETKKNLGANAIVGVSIAIAKAAAKSKKIPLYQYLNSSKNKKYIIPCPMMNIINGGMHGDNLLDIQEFMIRPIGASSFKECLRMATEVFHSLKLLLKNDRHSTSVGDEGGFAPNLKSEKEALEYIIKAIEKAGYIPKNDISIALDAAASSFFDKNTKKYFEMKKKMRNLPFKERSSEELISYLQSLKEEFPIDTIEDGLDENDWEGWQKLTKAFKENTQIVGDDIFVTNKKFFQKGIDEKVANSILIKLNQIGTVTETIEVINLAKENNYKTVVSHRSGDTEDTFIADFAVGLNAKQIKTGSLSRSERTSKYNRLLEIEDELKENAVFEKI